jgi:hypothetical protein
VKGSESVLNKLKIDNRMVIFLVMLSVFVFWLVAVVFFILPLILDPLQSKGLDLVLGLGVGGITQFFLTILTLIFQFYFRKKEGDYDNPPTVTPTGTK